MFNSISYDRTGRPPPGQAFAGPPSPAFEAAIQEAKAQAAAEAAAAHPTFSGPPAQVAQEITQQFIWGTHQGPLPTDGLQQVIDDLPAALQDNGALTQKMIGLAESLLSNGASGGEDGVLLDYTGAKLALEVAEQPDSQKHGVSERETMPDGGNHTYNVVITPGAPNGIGNGYSVLFKKEHGTFFSQVMGVVDNIVTPIVDAAAFIPVLTPFLAPVAIGLNVVEGSQQLAEGNILGGMLDIAAAAAGGVGEYFNAEATALNATDSIAATADRGTALIAGNVLKGVSAAQGLKGTIQAGIQGDGLAAFASAVGGIGGSGALGGGTGIDNLSRDALVASSLAGAGVAIQGGNALQALSAVTSAAGEAGLFQNTPPVPAPALNNRPAATQAYTDPVIPVTATALPDLTPNAAGSGAYGLNGSLGNLIDQSIIGSADSAAFSQPIQEDKGQLGSSGQINNAEVNLGPGFGLPETGGAAAGPYFEMAPSGSAATLIGTGLDIGGRLVRQLGLTARIGLVGAGKTFDGVNNTANALANLLIDGSNAVFGLQEPQFQYSNAAGLAGQAATALGLPQPATPLEQAVQNIGALGVGMMLPAGVAGALSSFAADGVDASAAYNVLMRSPSDAQPLISTAKPWQSVEPRDLNEQILWNQVISDPAFGEALPLKGDLRFPQSEGWQKMQVSKQLPDGSHITIHYQFNFQTGIINDIKIVTPQNLPNVLQPGPSIRN